jgi:Putative auto-transporter adhesin, head GIN domain
MTVAPTPLHRRHMPYHHQVALIVATVIVTVAVVLLVQHDVFQGSSPSSTQGSGTAASDVRHLAAFTGVELAGANNVIIRVGRKQSVVVRGDDNLLRRVTTRVQAGTLVIGNIGSFTTKSPMSVHIAVPSLTALTLSGSGIISTENIRASRLTLTLSGSGVLRAGGTATRLDISLGGSGDAQLEQLVARDAHAVVSGSGRIVVTATHSLDASVPGSGAIVYHGDPAHVTTSITGSGAVTRG